MDVIVYAALCPEQEEHTAARALLRYAVEQEFGLRELPEIVLSDGGKPRFRQYPRLCFNISHSGGGVVCALHDRPVGVDVEKLRPAPRRLAGGRDDRAFFLHWTAMEATIKRAGRDWRSLLDGPEPDCLCRSSEETLPGWIITVCPETAAEIRWKRVELAPAT